MAFRTLLPDRDGALWKFKPAADGQMGCILKLYREWQMSGDDAFLRTLWPAREAGARVRVDAAGTPTATA